MHAEDSTPARRLSPRECEVAALVSRGFSNREIAGELHLTEDTVKKHVSSALGKLGVRSRTQLAIAWRERGAP